MSPPSLEDFGAALPEGVDLPDDVVAAIVKRLVQARDNEEDNRCIVSMEPLLIDGRAGPEGLVAVVAPPEEGQGTDAKVRVNLYTMDSARGWLCQHDPRDPMVNKPLRTLPSTHVLALTQGPICLPNPPQYRSTLRNAVEMCDIEATRTMLADLSDEDVRALNTNGESVLFYVFSNNCVRNAELLLERMDVGTVSHQNNLGWTVLHRAAIGGQYDLVRLFLDHMDNAAVSATITSRLWGGAKTALGLAAEMGFEQTFRLILARRNPAELSRQDSPSGRTVLMHAVERFHDPRGPPWRIHTTDVIDKPAIVRRLLRVMDEHAVLLQDSRGLNALHAAAKSGNDGVFHALLSGMSAYGVRSHDPNGWTVLHHAANAGGPIILHSVLEAVSDDNFVVHRSSSGQTALHLAMGSIRQQGVTYTEATDGHQRIIRELIERMARSSVTAQHIATRDNQGRTALHAACAITVIEVLLTYVQGPQHLDNVRLLLRYMDSVAVAATDLEGLTALHIAAGQGLDGIVIELLGRMDDSAVGIRDHRQRTVLHHAASSKNGKVVGPILDRMRRQDIAAKDDQGMTALQVAYKNGHAASATRILMKLPFAS